MKKLLALPIAIIVSLTSFSQSATSGEALYKGFISPGNAARPRVWWHWMNGNVTKDGIRKDLEWMHRSGIGGFQNFDASLMTPQVVEKRLTYMTPGWIDAFGFATRLADSLKLEMAIAGSPGWSESGGPWVKPADGMKKITWTEKFARTGDSDIQLDRPAGTTGPFQNISKQQGMSEAVDHDKLPSLYKDIAIVAYRLPAHDLPIALTRTTVTSSGGHFNLSQLTDGDVGTTTLLPADSVKGFAWIQFAFDQPQVVRAVTIVGGGDKGPFGLYGEFKDTRSLEISDDGQNFKWVCFIPAGNVLQQTIAIPPTTAKYFRVTIKNPPPPFNFGGLVGGSDAPKPPAGTPIAELVLHPGSRIHMFEEKAAFAPALNLFDKPTPAGSDAIIGTDVIDLTGKLDAGGKLNWTVPAGNWKVVRFGYSLLGINNHPASPEATGLEVDKLNAGAVERYFSNYLDQYKKATGGLMGAKGGLKFIVTDSWEAGAQNWTDNLPQQFRTRRGYDIIQWLPVLTGHIIESAEASEKFLFDFRKTLSELVAEYHYDALTTILAKYGMKRYSESHENGRTLIADGMEVKRTAAVPMSAMWTPGGIGGGASMHDADIRESASVAHIYGQNLVAAESLTALGSMGNAWSYTPEKLKPTADLEMASGLNRFVIHTSVHQPLDDKIPGIGLGPFGQWFTRHETWSNYARAWTDYLARSCYMLQQGKFVADIVYYYGEDNNITSLFGTKPPAIPAGYNFDYINADALTRLLSVKDGRLVTPSGMSYRLLVLDSNATRMSLAVLRKVHALAKAGAFITGVKPLSTPGLKDDEAEFKRLVSEVWNAGNQKVFTGRPLQDVLTTMNIPPDFTYANAAEAKLLYVHRKLPDSDIYWINNRKEQVEEVDVSFRLSGRSAEIWHPETGLKEAASYSFANGRTTVKLELQPNDAVFVVFGKTTSQEKAILPTMKEVQSLAVSGEWKLDFQPNRGAPAEIILPSLGSWTEHAEPGIKYFSGTATYSKPIEIPAGWLMRNSEVWLDLGDVKNIAEVLINGKTAGIVWKKPFRVNVTKQLRSGNNQLEIKVTNLWVNRLIGDQQPGVKKITYTTMPFYRANSPLLPSGLLGPVKLLSLTK